MQLLILHKGNEFGEKYAKDSSLPDPGSTEYAKFKVIPQLLKDSTPGAEEQLGSLRKAEVNARPSYSMLMQSLTDRMAADNRDLGAERGSKASSLELHARR